jgi:hypothetical protein
MSEGRDEKGKFVVKNLYHLMRERIGRPLKIKSPEELALKALEYFEWSDQNDKGKYTFAGLRMWIGFSRENWREYKVKPDFVDTMNQIEGILEDFFEKKLQWAGSTQGAIFWLKNKAGWKDESQQKIDQTITEVKPEVISGTPKIEESL